MDNIRRRVFIEGALIALGSAIFPNSAKGFFGNLTFKAQNLHNILLITVDDMDWESTGLFNNINLHITPNINQLGREGTSFKRSHVAIAGCYPSRSAIFSGRLPHRNGTTRPKLIDDDVLVLPEILRRTGYLTGLAGKTSHTLPNRRDAFDHIFRNSEIGHGRNPDGYYEITKNFLIRSKREKKPFFLNLNIGDPHRPFAGSPDDRDASVMVRNYLEKIDPVGMEFLKVRAVGQQIYDRSDIFVPGFLPDIPEIRDELTSYYSSVARADKSVGRILEALADFGLEGETLVIFLSDHGMHMPFAKANVYPFSTAASLIIRAPFLDIHPSVNEENFVCSTDIFPTVLDILGIENIRYLDGETLLPILTKGVTKARDHCFTYRYEYPMRAMHDRKYSYIYNFWSDGRTRFQPFYLNNPSAHAMHNRGQDNPMIAARYRHFVYREKEELYDIEVDPYCLKNLMTNHQEAHSGTVSSMRKAMQEQMRKTDDSLLYQFEEEILKTG